MGAGALDAVNTPTLEQAGANIGTHALLGKIQTINRLIAHRDTGIVAAATQPQPYSPPRQKMQLLVIGASAGGPAAVAKVLAKLPAEPELMGQAWSAASTTTK